MHEPHAHPPVATEQHPEHHEATDVQVKPLVWFVVAFFIVTILIQVGLYWVFWVYKSTTEPASNIREVSSDVAKKMKVVVPNPQVQGVPGFHDNTPRQDTDEMKQRVFSTLATKGDSYDKGYYRIPIEDAMRLAAQRKLIKPRIGPSTTEPKGGAGVSH